MKKKKSFRERLWYATQSLRMIEHTGTEVMKTEGPRSYTVHVPCQCGNCPKSEPYPQHMIDEDIMDEALE